MRREHFTAFISPQDFELLAEGGKLSLPVAVDSISLEHPLVNYFRETFNNSRKSLQEAESEEL
jgi:hypothetical protein